MSQVRGRNRSEEKYKLSFYFICKLFSKIILKKLSRNQKEIFRPLEGKCIQFIKNKADIEFLNYCKVNQLFPNFLRIRLYDKNLQDNKLTIDFKLKLLDNEINKQKLKNCKLRIDAGENLLTLKKSTGNLYFYSLIFFLSRKLQELENDIKFKHISKLQNLYKGQFILK